METVYGALRARRGRSAALLIIWLRLARQAFRTTSCQLSGAAWGFLLTATSVVEGSVLEQCGVNQLGVTVAVEIRVQHIEIEQTPNVGRTRLFESVAAVEEFLHDTPQLLETLVVSALVDGGLQGTNGLPTDQRILGQIDERDGLNTAVVPNRENDGMFDVALLALLLETTAAILLVLEHHPPVLDLENDTHLIVAFAGGQRSDRAERGKFEAKPQRTGRDVREVTDIILGELLALGAARRTPMAKANLLTTNVLALRSGGGRG